MQFYYHASAYVLFGVAPSLIWLFYYLGKDLHPEPKKMVLKVFLFGALSTIPVFFIEIGLNWLLQKAEPLSLFELYPVIVSILKWFIVIALTEEVLKYLTVKLAVFRSHELDEPLDIMLYMAIGSLGFAALENILYLFSPVDVLSFSILLKTTLMVSFIRFIGATFLHTLCSALIGYFWAWSLLEPQKRKLLIFFGILLAATAHGTYNFSIITLGSPFNMIIPAGLLIVLGAVIMSEFDRIKKWKDVCIIPPISGLKQKLKSIKTKPYFLSSDN